MDKNRIAGSFKEMKEPPRRSLARLSETPSCRMTVRPKAGSRAKPDVAQTYEG
jgi:hypothetical protein